MKLKRLELTAFGPFTGKTLEFDGDKPGLHIIFGPNEAGKSSALRALKVLLYGFPQQTSDDFLHSYGQLLVGGCLENSSGDEICFQRRKKRIGDIIDGEGNPLDPGILASFLHGMAAEIFDTLYGINHGSLIRGGEEILARKGEVGQALFAAGAGVTSLSEIIDQLDKEAAGLFKSTGQLPEINRAIKRFKELKKEAREAILSAGDWKKHHKALEHAQLERAELEKERDKNHRELQRLERLQRAIPELASLKARQNQLQKMGEVTLLPPDFEAEYQQTVQKIREAGLQLQKDSYRLTQIDKNRTAVTFNPDLLDQAGLVDDLQLRLGEYRKGQKDRPERNGMRIALKREAALLLQEVRPDLSLAEVDTLRPILSRKRTIQSLTGRYGALSEQLKQAGKNRAAAEEELQEVMKMEASLPKSLEAGNLFQTVKLARKSGEIDSHIEKSRTELEQETKAALRELKRLGLSPQNLSALMELNMPLPQTVQQFQADYNSLRETGRGLENDRKNIERELTAATAEIKTVIYSGSLPSEEELSGIRKKRDRGWQLLRWQWLGGKDVTAESASYSGGKSLPDAYEEYVSQADLTADRLRREADRVAGLATLRTRVESAEEQLKENDKQQLAMDRRGKKLDAAWAEIWQDIGVSPLSPEEMRGWLAEVDKLRYRVGEILKKEHQTARLVKQREELRAAVIKELERIGEETAPAGDALAPVLIFAEDAVEKITALRGSHETVREKKKRAREAFRQADKEVNSTTEEMTTWQKQWQNAISGLGLANEVSTLEAIDLIEILQNCFSKLKEAEDLKKRIVGIDRDAEELERDVKVLLEKTAPEKVALPLDQAVLQLRGMLDQARKNSILHDKLSREYDSLQLDVLAGEKILAEADSQMAKLLQIAKCDKPDKVSTVIGRFAEYRRLREKTAETEASLARIGSGITVEELARQAEKVDGDELPLLSGSLRRQIDEQINPEINSISQKIGEQTTILADMDGSGRGAEVAEEMEQELAKIRRLVERYTRVKLASKVLQQEIERYREEHQDPVLKAGAGYFSELTMGSFTNLKTDVDDRGTPVLVGIRPDQSRVTVEGMSDGTRDQLYLALRLATLEFRLETSEPMPFIVDDILINFDDQRSRTTLEALARLGDRNQILLFTHHHRIVEEAKKLQNAGKIHLHML